VTDFSVADLTQAMRAITVMLLDAAMPTLGEADLQAMEANIRAAEAVIDDPQKRSAILIQFYRQLAEASEKQDPRHDRRFFRGFSCNNGWSGSAH